MTAGSFITHAVPVLAPEATVGDALEVMAESLLSELPLVDKGVFLGIVSEDTLASLPGGYITLASLPPSGATAFVQEDAYFYEILRVAAVAKTKIVAILDAQSQFVGAIELAEVAQRLGSELFLEIPGGVLVLSIKQLDYSLAEIARLVEGNNAKVLASHIEADTIDPLYLKVVLRINQTDLSRVIATLERFSYTVSASYHQATEPSLDQERLNQLLKYLSI